ncbi:caspase family protein [Campylobacter coli]|uniref:caspase family protein n=1 Tax=Campylobacter coli TaxID=195 RepID=UPI000930589B|nr:caspase family protein [Campylobacter coli]HED6588243.1 caspase family protein [Campylobacter coli]HED6595469.1 caspase family protein [Campylobacter coli]HED6603894.1 caspase family protein [Campylobacter coli]
MRRALIVGINNYPTAPLTSCIDDANFISSILQRNSDGSPNFDVKLLTDSSKPLTKVKLKEQIENLFTLDCDIALFYFSGHGFLKNNGGYIVTSDYQKYDEGISMDEILIYANNSTIRNKVIILDCCYSGAFGTPSINNNGLAQLSNGLTILTASRDSESALEINGSGLFTRLLADALYGGASDLRGNITPGSIYSYIDQALGAWDQRPVFKTNVTKFISLRQTTPPIPLEELRKIKELFDDATKEIQLDPSFEPTSNCPNEDNCEKFRILQKYNRINLVIPVGEEHMYYAAMNSKTCRLTAKGYHYWRLAKENKL